MARKPVKRAVVIAYIAKDWPYVTKQEVIEATGVSATYAHKLLREYELIQKSLGNVHSSGRTEAKPATASQATAMSYVMLERSCFILRLRSNG